ncbi:unnamed protein product [Caenorhabditis nigoni]
MILRFLFILISFPLSLIDSCVRTIPPEEVYITSTPDNLPITEERISVAPVTNAPVTNAPVTEGPVTDAPVTDAPITESPVTDAPVDPDPCTNCDVEKILPDFVDDVSSCSVISVTCERTDGAVCNSVGVSAIIPSDPNPVTITDTSTTTRATGTIKCSKDGTFSHLTTTGIEKLVCDFNTCILPCTKCDIGSIFKIPDVSGTISYSKIVSGPGECTKIDVFCQRDDGQSCNTIFVEAISSFFPFPLVITDSLTSTYGSSTLEFANDGTFTYNSAAGDTHNHNLKNILKICLTNALFS